MAERDLDSIRDEMKLYMNKIKQRIDELGDEDVMTYRHDEAIKSALENICTLYHEVNSECEYYDAESEPVCSVFRDKPEILKRLELTEEELCPLKAQKVS
jgi:hypothetical protein